MIDPGWWYRNGMSILRDQLFFSPEVTEELRKRRVYIARLYMCWLERGGLGD